MRRSTAAAGTAAFSVLAPGTLVGLVPWLITRWEPPGTSAGWRVAQVLGALLIVLGLVPAMFAFAEFAKAGGTPLPFTPTQHLVVSGFNRYIRNPMYVGGLLAIVGQALLFGSLGLVAYALFGWIVTASFVRWYEEPTLARQYGDEYEEYRRNVPAWRPRRRPWTRRPADHVSLGRDASSSRRTLADVMSPLVSKPLAALLMFNAALTAGAVVLLTVSPATIPATVGFPASRDGYPMGYMLAAAEVALTVMFLGACTISDLKALRLILLIGISFHIASASAEIYAVFQHQAGNSVWANIALRMFLSALLAIAIVQVSRGGTLKSAA